MARLNDTVRAALGYWWNLISDAARTGLTVTDTVQLANQVASDFGQSIGFRENTAISTLYGYARREVNASEAFQGAPLGATITPDMISIPPYARDQEEMASYPLWHVKFSYTFIDSSGQEQTTIRTSAQPLVLPDNTADLADAVLDDAEAFANKYGHQLVSAVPFAILAV